jgi:hypothetical protein
VVLDSSHIQPLWFLFHWSCCGPGPRFLLFVFLRQGLTM